jgi:hypothetical protein
MSHQTIYELLVIESQVKNIETGLQGDYARKLHTIRSGSADKVELWQLLEEFGSGNSKIHKLADITSGSYKEKIRFLNGLVAQGAKYIGFNSESLDLELGTNPDIDIHVLSFQRGSQNPRGALEAEPGSPSPNH